ncbi:Glucoamylase [Favolaschia claudopus]|uniref:glucan 1,4-alpha-glucosidase n=1 Tax=Favolaschia claudopus TaxID=2862362 RepID=A0AAW0D7Z7_9AGAR
MRVVLFSALSICGAALAQSSVDSYVAKELPIAKAGLLANIGSTGSKSQGAKAGIVIASPSKVDPDYVFTWVRDSSLVFKVIIDQFTSGEDTTLLGQIQNFITAETALQQVSNPSGTISTGGLGEPKFEIDGTAFTGSWGRWPRPPIHLHDRLANWLLKNTSTTSEVLDTLWPAIKLDLDYVTASWNQTGFDLWEEVQSSSFFTTAVQHRSLREGAALAGALGQDGGAYTEQADNALWYITANTGGGRSGKDANTALASIHTFDPEAGCSTLIPSARFTLSTTGIAANAAVATGRYPEDVYFGGNPWYLATAAVAEQLYDALFVWNAQGSLEVTPISLAFFRQFDSNVAVGTYASSTPTFHLPHRSRFLEVHAKYTPADGGLAEQFDRNNGTPLSAVDQTWSYAAALTVFAAREGKAPASWGAKGGPQGAVVSTTFNVVAETVLGEDIYLTGSVDALMNWSPENALKLNPDNYPTWSGELYHKRSLWTSPASALIEYKYIRKVNGQFEGLGESDPNNQVTTPATGPFVLNDNWR